MAGHLDHERHLEGQTDQLGVGRAARLPDVVAAASAPVAAMQHCHLRQVLLACHLHRQIRQRHGGEERHCTFESTHAAEVLLEGDVVTGTTQQCEEQRDQCHVRGELHAAAGDC